MAQLVCIENLKGEKVLTIQIRRGGKCSCRNVLLQKFTQTDQHVRSTILYKSKA